MRLHKTLHKVSIYVLVIGGGRWSKVRGSAAKNANELFMTFYFTIFGTFSAIGEHEATICLKLSRVL